MGNDWGWSRMFVAVGRNKQDWSRASVGEGGVGQTYRSSGQE